MPSSTSQSDEQSDEHHAGLGARTTAPPLSFQSINGDRTHSFARWIFGRRAILTAIAVAVLLGGPGSGSAAAIDWTRIEQQILFHRQRVKLCGPLSVARVLSLRGHSIASREWFQDFARTAPDGLSIGDVVKLLARYEPSATTAQIDTREIGRMPLPAILLVNQSSHCVVLEDWDSDTGTATIWDPSDLTRKPLNQQMLNEMWSGEMIWLAELHWGSLVLNAVNLLVLTLLSIRTVRLLVQARRGASMPC
jgi:hypothetical protein